MNRTAFTLAPKKVGAGLGVALVASLLSACEKQASDPAGHPAYVRTEIVRPKARQSSVTQTGEVQARYRAELAFRVSGRVIARLVEVGAHVEADQVLARLDPSEQQADLDAATAAVAASESQLRVAAATFQRQKTLLCKWFHHPRGIRPSAGRAEKRRSLAGGHESPVGQGERSAGRH